MSDTGEVLAMLAAKALARWPTYGIHGLEMALREAHHKGWMQGFEEAHAQVQDWRRWSEPMLLLTGVGIGLLLVIVGTGIF